jgi:Tol biopolymer transport system component
LSTAPSIAADVRYVAFTSLATNLAASDPNHDMDICLHDRQTGQATLVSATVNGNAGNAFSWLPPITGDSRYLSFTSAVSDLVTGDTNENYDVFVLDRCAAEAQVPPVLPPTRAYVLLLPVIYTPCPQVIVCAQSHSSWRR